MSYQSFHSACWELMDEKSHPLTDKS